MTIGPGWQPDPTGRHGQRYFDGARWTEHVADAGAQSIDPAPPAPMGPPPIPGPGPWAGTGWGFAPVREHPEGTTILVLGILSLVVCGLLGPFAWTKGNRALAEINSQPSISWTNRGQIRAGQICGIISSCLLIFGAAVFALALAVAAGSN